MTPAEYVARIIELESELEAERAKYRDLLSRFHKLAEERADERIEASKLKRQYETH